MNFALGLLLGCLVGWMAFKFLRVNSEQGVRTSLLIGLVGGGMGMQLAPFLSRTPVADGTLNVFALIVAAVTASAFLLVAGMVTRR
jgi:uncharacterized membrane protein YeaQ/YmgE (transglycosylase-associated protein family)